MASKHRLNPQILTFLMKKLNRKEATIRSQISRLRHSYPDSTLNAVAQIYAIQDGESVRRLLTKEDKATIPAIRVEKKPVVIHKKKRAHGVEIKNIIHFETSDHFLRKHLAEINRAYTYRCYTCVFILSRKVFENLLVSILKAKYPTDRDLYFDKPKGRNHDFSVVLDCLFQKRNEFGDKKEVIERLHQKLKPFKNDANDKAHSLYHIVENAGEIEAWNLDSIIALIDIIKK